MTSVGGVGEAKLIELIKPYLSSQAGRDDAAVIESPGGFEIVSADMSVENVHFDLSWMKAEDAGWRALALALGDLAAKGATPVWTLTSVAVPRRWNLDDFVHLFAGIDELAKKVGMSIEGGDLSAIDGPAVIAITVTGCTQTRPLPRSAARPGWAVAVTGPLGSAAVALREKRALRLEPLIDEGRRLNHAGLCCGDISDGLVRELEKFAEMSGNGFHLRAHEVPVAEGASLEEALTSGEEAQLVCVGPEEAIRVAGLTPIGEITTADRHAGIDGASAALRGYDHFA